MAGEYAHRVPAGHCTKVQVPAIAGCYALMATRAEALDELDRVFGLIREEYQERGQALPADSTEILHA